MEIKPTLKYIVTIRYRNGKVTQHHFMEFAQAKSAMLNLLRAREVADAIEDDECFIMLAAEVIRAEVIPDIAGYEPEDAEPEDAEPEDAEPEDAEPEDAEPGIERVQRFMPLIQKD